MSEQTAHTPGPFQWFPNIACSGELKGAFVYADVNGERNVIAEVSARNVNSQEVCEANAALFSASADMRGLLKNIAALPSAMLDIEKAGLGEEFRSAIAKAEGRS